MRARRAAAFGGLALGAGVVLGGCGTSYVVPAWQPKDGAPCCSSGPSEGPLAPGVRARVDATASCHGLRVALTVMNEGGGVVTWNGAPLRLTDSAGITLAPRPGLGPTCEASAKATPGAPAAIVEGTPLELRCDFPADLGGACGNDALDWLDLRQDGLATPAGTLPVELRLHERRQDEREREEARLASSGR
ncbi:MAG TPA: hypothetical protein VHL80_17335 [Polyangia bacterium]|nr:hypothetical protein [Polyangia bacterium]